MPEHRERGINTQAAVTAHTLGQSPELTVFILPLATRLCRAVCELYDTRQPTVGRGTHLIPLGKQNCRVPSEYIVLGFGVYFLSSIKH